MKNFRKVCTVTIITCLAAAFAVSGSPVQKSITYSDETGTITVAEDNTFAAVIEGKNLEGSSFELQVSGTVDQDGKVQITGLTDGQVELLEMASAEQLAGDAATVEALYKAAIAGAEKKTAAPGTYTDGKNTLVLEEDQSFVVTTEGQNMEGEPFVLYIIGTFSEEGEPEITSLTDGNVELLELSTEEQRKGNYDTVRALYEIALKESADAPAAAAGTYVDGDNVLEIKEDHSFEMKMEGRNMENDPFVLTVKGTVSEEGKFEITGLFDGDMDLTGLASEEQLAENYQALEAALAAGISE